MVAIRSLVTATPAFTKDKFVHSRGRPILRSKKGGWNACSFVVVYVVFEMMAYYGITSNLVIYSKTKLHLGIVSSSNNVTNWAGTIWINPIFGAYIADVHLGRYWTFCIASCIYLLVAFQNKAMQNHPDQNQRNKEVVEAKFKELMMSYEATK